MVSTRDRELNRSTLEGCWSDSPSVCHASEPSHQGSRGKKGKARGCVSELRLGRVRRLGLAAAASGRAHAMHAANVSRPGIRRMPGSTHSEHARGGPCPSLSSPPCDLSCLRRRALHSHARRCHLLLGLVKSRRGEGFGVRVWFRSQVTPVR